MYHLGSNQKNARKIKHPQKKHNKGRQRAVYCAELHNCSNIPGKNMFGNLKEYCCKKGTDECM
jgi:hypothetical protein